MCGICGIKADELPPLEVLKRMAEALRHRGPDEAGWYRCSGYMAGMRRLSINDLTGGGQPLYNVDRSVVLFYNGEIYNSPQLRRELEAEGVTFRTCCDGEVLCHLYDREGEGLFARLDGMFACALWSVRERKLILARDLPGEKPLYYTRLGRDGLAFASEIKSLLRLPGIDRELDMQALWDFPTFLWIPEPATAFQAIKSLPRGHLLVADAEGVRLRPYPNRFVPASDPAGLPQEEVVALVRREVTRAVHSRLLSDVPVGCFLSGGLDSSIVSTLAAQVLPSLSTFTIGFEDLADPYHGRSDESAQAEETARRLGSIHHTIRVTSRDFRGMLTDFCAHGDQPFAVSSGLGILAVARAARERGITVLLSGDGADEAFGGYSWYLHLRDLAGRRPAPAPDTPVSYQNFGLPLARRLDVLAGYDAPARAWAWHYYAAETEKASLFASGPFAGAASSLRHFQAFKNGPWEPLDYLRQDRAFYFPFEMLTKADRMTMGCSVEGRIPFAAPAVSALAAALPLELLVRGGELKWVLRRAFDAVLPPEVVSRPKHGFNVPIDHWLKNEWSDMLTAAFSPSSALCRRGLVAPGALDTARAMLADPQRLNGHTLFCYIMLDMWLDMADTWIY